MPLTLSLAALKATSAETAALAVFATDAELAKQPVLHELDTALGGALFERAEAVEFKGKPGSIIELPTLGRLSAARLIVVGVGPKRAFDGAVARKYAAVAARAAQAAKATSLSLLAPDKASAETLRALAEGLCLGAYRFTKYLTGARRPKSELSEVVLLCPGAKLGPAQRRALATGEAIAGAVALARDLVNEPPNVLTPEELAARARLVAEQGKLGIEVLDKAGIHAAGMRLHYAVGQGSENEPRFVHLSYTPKRAKKKLAFVGKGLTFDSGGLCIKPAPGMEEMKSDMSGAAVVLALMAAVAELRPDVEVHGIIAAAENMPSGSAYRPADVFTSLDGKTVEIINTDAEGRLVLADALAYATKLAPDAIIEASTLTGACIVALGKTCAGYMTRDEALAKQLEQAASEAGEAYWRLPLIDELREQLKSTTADLKHAGDRWGGAIVAALFLNEFVGEVPYLHCDIAGPALAPQPSGIYPAGGTGHSVLTFIRLIEHATA